jgi:hypothetical protein
MVGAGRGTALGEAIWTAPQDIVGLAKLLGLAVRQRGMPKMRTEGGAVIAEDPELDTPAAQLGGRYVAVGPSSAQDPDVLKHELRHVGQSRALGPAALPLSLMESLGGEYGTGPLERDAMRNVTPNTEMLREKSSEYKKPRGYSGAIESYLKGILGE